MTRKTSFEVLIMCARLRRSCDALIRDYSYTKNFRLGHEHLDMDFTPSGG